MSGDPNERILSQEEVVALISTVGDKPEALDGEPPAAKYKKVVKYDIRKPDRLSKEQIRSLNLIHTNFERSFSSSLSAYLRAFVEIKLQSIDQIIYSEFLGYIVEPTCYNAVSMNPLEGNMVLEISYSVVFPMIDLLLGGAGRPPREGRLITDIEWSIVDGVMRLALGDLMKAWMPVIELDMHVTAHESKPRLLQFVSLAESLVAVGFEMRIGDTSGTMNLGIPSILLKLLGKKFEQQQWGMRRKDDAARDQERVQAMIKSIPVSTKVEIGSRSFIRARDFLNFKEGDVIAFDCPIDRPALVSVEGVPRFRGRLVRLQERRGVIVQGRASELELYS